jgi:hypothetical protein
VKLHSLDDDADSFTDSKNPSIKKEERRKLKQKLDQLKTQSKISEIIHTYEHRNYLFKALKEAKQRLMIVSPWITGYVVDQNFLEMLEETLKKKYRFIFFMESKAQANKIIPYQFKN